MILTAAETYYDKILIKHVCYNILFIFQPPNGKEHYIISQHLLYLIKKTWELQIVHFTTTNLMMHSYCYPERGAHKSSFFREMKAHNFQLPIIWEHPKVSCVSKNYFEEVNFEFNFLWFYRQYPRHDYGLTKLLNHH